MMFSARVVSVESTCDISDSVIARRLELLVLMRLVQHLLLLLLVSDKIHGLRV